MMDNNQKNNNILPEFGYVLKTSEHSDRFISNTNAQKTDTPKVKKEEKS